MRLFNILLLLFIASALLIGGVMAKYDADNGISTDIRNLTSNITWEDIDPINISIGNSSYAIAASGVMNRAIDFFGYTAIETMKIGVEFGYNNPQYDWEFVFAIIKFALIATIAGALAPLLIPFLALIVILVIGIKTFIKFIINKYKEVKKNGK